MSLTKKSPNTYEEIINREKYDVRVSSNFFSDENLLEDYQIGHKTTAMDLIKMIFFKHNMITRDPNLFYLTTKRESFRNLNNNNIARKNGSIGPKSVLAEMLDFENNDEITLNVNVRSGGLLEIHQIVYPKLSPSLHLYISKMTTAQEVIELLLINLDIHVDEFQKEFQLYEEDSSKIKRILKPDDCPLLVYQTSGNKSKLILRRTKGQQPLLGRSRTMYQNNNKALLEKIKSNERMACSPTFDESSKAPKKTDVQSNLSTVYDLPKYESSLDLRSCHHYNVIMDGDYYENAVSENDNKSIIQDEKSSLSSADGNNFSYNPIKEENDKRENTEKKNLDKEYRKIVEETKTYPRYLSISPDGSPFDDGQESLSKIPLPEIEIQNFHNDFQESVEEIQQEVVNDSYNNVHGSRLCIVDTGLEKSLSTSKLNSYQSSLLSITEKESGSIIQDAKSTKSLNSYTHISESEKPAISEKPKFQLSSMHESKSMASNVNLIKDYSYEVAMKPLSLDNSPREPYKNISFNIKNINIKSMMDSDEGKLTVKGSNDMDKDMKLTIPSIKTHKEKLPVMSPYDREVQTRNAKLIRDKEEFIEDPTSYQSFQNPFMSQITSNSMYDQSFTNQDIDLDEISWQQNLLGNKPPSNKPTEATGLSRHKKTSHNGDSNQNERKNSRVLSSMRNQLNKEDLMVIVNCGVSFEKGENNLNRSTQKDLTERAGIGSPTSKISPSRPSLHQIIKYCHIFPVFLKPYSSCASLLSESEMPPDLANTPGHLGITLFQSKFPNSPLKSKDNQTELQGKRAFIGSNADEKSAFKPVDISLIRKTKGILAINSIIPQSPAFNEGSLAVGHLILECNGQSFLNDFVDVNIANQILSRAVRQCNSELSSGVELTIARYRSKPLNPISYHENNLVHKFLNNIDYSMITNDSNNNNNNNQNDDFNVSVIKEKGKTRNAKEVAKEMTRSEAEIVRTSPLVEAKSTNHLFSYQKHLAKSQYDRGSEYQSPDLSSINDSYMSRGQRMVKFNTNLKSGDESDLLSQISNSMRRMKNKSLDN